MDGFERTGIKQFESDARHPENIYLTQELAEIYPALMVNESRPDKRDTESDITDARRHVDVL